MKKAQRIIAVILTVLLLVSSGVSGMASVSAVDVKDAEAATEQMTEHSGLKTAQKPETETAAQQESGAETESETKQTETQKAAESETPETKKPQSAETEKPQQAETEKPKKAAKAKVVITREDDLKGFFPDPDIPEDPEDPQKNSFRKAVFESLAAYNWLAGDPDDPPETIEEILGTYRGPIHASGKGITSIEGIQYLKLAGTDSSIANNCIDLTNNKITSLLPLTKKGEGGDNPYYGGILGEAGKEEATSVYIKLLGNPIRYFPETLDGWKLGSITIDDLTFNTAQVVSEDQVQYFYLRDDSDKEGTVTFDGTLQIGYCKFVSREGVERDYVNIESVLVDRRNIVLPPIDPTQMKMTLSGQNLEFNNLTKSGMHTIGVGTGRVIRTYNLNPDTFAYIWIDKTYSYQVHPTFTIFDHVTVDGTQKGSAKAYKVAFDTKMPLEGAVFDLYRKVENGTDVLVEKDLVTQKDGYTKEVLNLEPGEYYFQEVQAPAGYILNPLKLEFSVGYSFHIDGGVKNLDYKDPDGNPIVKTAGDKETYITLDMERDIELYLKDGKGQRIDDSKGIIKNVTVNYKSLNGVTGQAENTESYATLEEAEKALNGHIRKNDITGSVKVTVEYAESTLDDTVNVESIEEGVLTDGIDAIGKLGNMPSVTVQVDKTWLGIDSDDVLPAVTYELYQGKSKDGDKTLINTYTVEADKKKNRKENTAETKADAETGNGTSKEGDPSDPENRYDHLFENDKEGNPLPKYWKDEDDTYKPYIYTIKEKITENDIIASEGYVEEPSEPDESNQITIKVTNIRKPAIVVKKSDLDHEKDDLSGVKFKLEKKQSDGTWVQIGDEAVTDKDGRAEFENLDWGEYRITETETWSGYILLEKPIENIVIEKPETSENYEKEFVYMVGNSKKYHVPKSGGIGTIWFIISGSLLMFIGGLWGYKRRFCRIGEGSE